jgi:anti-anti-sigma factor
LHGNVMTFLAPNVLSISSEMKEYVVHAPTSLGTGTRALFRRKALETIEQLLAAGDEAPLVIDLSRTRAVDSAGLGVLVLIQRRAAEVRRPVRLRGPSEELRFLLVMTRLDDRFICEGPAFQ